MFRPCIDLHEGKVKQIVGGTLTDAGSGPQTHFVSERPSRWYAELYRRDQLRGGHVIMLGPGNETAALEALQVYPKGLHIGGGIHPNNAERFLKAGASHVIVTSFVFRHDTLDWTRLKEISKTAGRDQLVLDLSCRQRGNDYVVMANRWQSFTKIDISAGLLSDLAEFCAEYLIHAVDVEGLCQGIDARLVERLAEQSPLPVTYAGGATSLADLEFVTRISAGRVHLTIGSALDIFGGSGVRYAEAVAFNRRVERGELKFD